MLFFQCIISLDGLCAFLNFLRSRHLSFGLMKDNVQKSYFQDEHMLNNTGNLLKHAMCSQYGEFYNFFDGILASWEISISCSTVMTSQALQKVMDMQTIQSNHHYLDIVYVMEPWLSSFLIGPFGAGKFSIIFLT